MILEVVKEKAKNIIIVDFSNLLYISSFSKFSKENGPNVSITMHQLLWKYQKIIKFLEKDMNIDFNESCIIFASDRKSKLRTEIYSNYKGHRKEDKHKQDYKAAVFDASILFLTYIPNISAYADEYEADDVINKLTIRFSDLNKNVYILSRDRDLWQLMKYNNVKIIDVIKYKEITIDDIKKDFKVGPEKIILYKTVYGDKSDNIDTVFKKLNIRNKNPTKVLEIIKDSNSIEEIADKLINLYKIENKEEFYNAILENYKLVNLYEPKAVNIGYSLGNKNNYLKMLEELNINRYPDYEIFKKPLKMFLAGGAGLEPATG